MDIIDKDEEILHLKKIIHEYTKQDPERMLSSIAEMAFDSLTQEDINNLAKEIIK